MRRSSAVKELACALLAVVLSTGCRDRATQPAPAPSAAPTGRSWTTPPPEGGDGGVVAAKLPRVGYRGGPFLRNPRVTTVTFKRDDPALVARLERFGDVVTRTRWWREVVDSYCVTPGDCIGEGTAGPHVHLDDELAASVRADEVDDRIARAAKEGKLGPLHPQTLLIVYLPAGVALVGERAFCAGGPRAYHQALEVGAGKVAYAVVPRCSDEDELTATASHEILEATTNPDPAERGFAFEKGPETHAFVLAGLEPVDPCGLLTMDTHRAHEAGFVLQRAWSNRAAALGRAPCVPSPDRPYAALVPRKPGVRVREVGEAATLVLDAASDRPLRAPWAVHAFDVTGDRLKETYFDASLDRSSVAAGETVTLTITLRKAEPGELGIVGLVSTVGVTSHMWPVFVVMK